MIETPGGHSTSAAMNMGFRLNCVLRNVDLS